MKRQPFSLADKLRARIELHGSRATSSQVLPYVGAPAAEVKELPGIIVAVDRSGKTDRAATVFTLRGDSSGDAVPQPARAEREQNRDASRRSESRPADSKHDENRAKLCRWTLTARRLGRPRSLRPSPSARNRSTPTPPEHFSDRPTRASPGPFLAGALSLRRPYSARSTRATDVHSRRNRACPVRPTWLMDSTSTGAPSDVERGIVACSPHQVWAVGQTRSGAARFGEHVTRATDRNAGLSR